MESCTGGLLASTITDVPGSSDYFKGGLVAYSAQTKAAFGVDAKLLAQKGTVDPEVAAAMAKAARLKLEADIGIGITGVAGPSEIDESLWALSTSPSMPVRRRARSPLFTRPAALRSNAARWYRLCLS
jgi:PncC family amidohydrolase